MAKILGSTCPMAEGGGLDRTWEELGSLMDGTLSPLGMGDGLPRGNDDALVDAASTQPAAHSAGQWARYPKPRSR